MTLSQTQRVFLRGFAACTVFASAILPSLAQQTNQVPVPDRLNQVAQSYTREQAFMGAALVARGDQILLDKGYGLASVEWQIPNAPEVKFRLGSLTKQFTATLVLLLQQDGKLDIHKPVITYLPDAPRTWEKITVEDLLRQSSGIPNFTDPEAFRTWAMVSHDWPKEYAAYLDKPLKFTPGSQFSYSNSNYEVLGVLIEKVSGQKYGDLLRTRIFDPLGMKDTGLDVDGLVLPKRAEGYGRSPRGLETMRTESMTVPWSAGSLYSTTGDLLRWERGLFGGKVLSAASLTAMTTPYKGGYALGVTVEGTGDERTIAHEGGIEGFNTFLAYVPAKQICVVVLGNVNGAAPHQVGTQLLQVALGKTVVLDEERKAVPIKASELTKFVGVYQLAPTFSLTVAIQGDTLTVQGTGQPAISTEYEGLENGHAVFFSKEARGRVEFIPDASGAITSLILHQAGRNQPARKM